MLFRFALAISTTLLFISCSSTGDLTQTSTIQETNSANTKVSSIDLPEPSKHELFVEDKEAAIEIAVNEWVRMGLREAIEQEKPYRAKLVGEVWEVSGTIPENWIGGAAYARILQQNGKVLEAGHDK